ncbi:MAG: LemA family protein [Nocardiaceae bacterium]|nr:LemA family protein [Nocardiaceae bacterium]
MSSVQRLRRAAERVDSALTLVHAELDRRYEYVPCLVLAASETVGRDLVTPVIGARSLAMRVREEELDLRRQAGAEKALSAALQAVLASGRRYPQLANDWAFVHPAHELEVTEERLAGAVRVYNEQARSLNHAIRTFPGNVLAPRLEITRAQLFQATILAVQSSEAPADDVVDDVAA